MANILLQDIQNTSAYKIARKDKIEHQASKKQRTQSTIKQSSVVNEKIDTIEQLSLELYELFTRPDSWFTFICNGCGNVYGTRGGDTKGHHTYIFLAEKQELCQLSHWNEDTPYNKKNWSYKQLYVPFRPGFVDSSNYKATRNTQPFWKSSRKITRQHCWLKEIPPNGHMFLKPGHVYSGIGIPIEIIPWFERNIMDDYRGGAHFVMGVWIDIQKAITNVKPSPELKNLIIHAKDDKAEDVWKLLSYSAKKFIPHYWKYIETWMK